MSADAFLDRVFQHVPRGAITKFDYSSWRYADRPTSEGFGVLPVPGMDPERMVARVMDVGHYPGNVDYVQTVRIVSDPKWVQPKAVHYYQQIKVPILGELQMELVLQDVGERDGWRVVAWHLLDAETARLNPKQGARSEYNVGAWLLQPGIAGYALSSAPMRDDVGRLKYAALTKGADAGAASVLKGAIEGMVRWSMR